MKEMRRKDRATSHEEALELLKNTSTAQKGCKGVQNQNRESDRQSQEKRTHG